MFLAQLLRLGLVNSPATGSKTNFFLGHFLFCQKQIDDWEVLEKEKTTDKVG